MAGHEDARLMPRKRPVQARSQATVAVLREASIQVLLAVGYRKLTTTRVADRAGVAVGSLYQYFPNRQALVNALLADYLDEICGAIERDCEALTGASLAVLARGLVDACIAAKTRRLALTRALHEPLVEVGGAPLVRAAAMRIADATARLLASCRDSEFERPRENALFVVTASVGLLQSALSDSGDAIGLEALRANLRAMVYGYLVEARRPRLEPDAASVQTC